MQLSELVAALNGHRVLVRHGGRIEAARLVRTADPTTFRTRQRAVGTLLGHFGVQANAQSVAG